MNESTLEAIARRAGATASRRSALMALGGAALAAIVAAPAAGKPGKKARKKANQQCANQAPACRIFLTDACGDDACGGDLERLLLCCEPFGSCDAGAAIGCFIPAE